MSEVEIMRVDCSSNIFACFYSLLLPVLIPELVKKYNSGNSAVAISKIVYFLCLL